MPKTTFNLRGAKSLDIIVTGKSATGEDRLVSQCVFSITEESGVNVSSSFTEMLRELAHEMLEATEK